MEDYRAAIENLSLDQLTKNLRALRESGMWESLKPSERNALRKEYKAAFDFLSRRDEAKTKIEGLSAIEQEDAENARMAQELRKEGGILGNLTRDFARGVATTPASAARVAGFALDRLGAKETGSNLTEYAQNVEDTANVLYPPPLPDAGMVEKIGSAAAENLAPMLATGFGTKSALKGIGRLTQAPRALKAAEIVGTGVGMSAPEILRESTELNEYGIPRLPENTTPIIAGSLMHGAIETGLGISPTSLVTKGKGKFLTGLFAKDTIKRIATLNKRYGPAKTAAIVASRIFKDTPLGNSLEEGFEEVLQGPVTILTKNLANADVKEALSKSFDEMANLGYLESLGEEFVIGTAVGGIYGGARTTIDKIDNAIESKKTSLKEKQDLAKQKEQLLLESDRTQLLLESDRTRRQGPPPDVIYSPVSDDYNEMAQRPGLLEAIDRKLIEYDRTRRQDAPPDVIYAQSTDGQSRKLIGTGEIPRAIETYRTQARSVPPGVINVPPTSDSRPMLELLNEMNNAKKIGDTEAVNRIIDLVNARQSQTSMPRKMERPAPQEVSQLKAIKEVEKKPEPQKKPRALIESEDKKEPAVALKTNDEIKTNKRSGKALAHSPSGRSLNVRYDAISADDLITSDMPEFPKELQPRDRTTLFSADQISKIAHSPIINKLITDYPDADTGSPIVVPYKGKYVVISGNGRTMGMRQGYEFGTMKEYKERLNNEGREYGIQNVTENKPIFVRVLEGEHSQEELKKLAIDLNRESKLAMSAGETANVDADAVRKYAHLVTNFSDITSTNNWEFLQSFFSATTIKSDLSKFISRAKGLTNDGVAKLERALFAGAYGDGRIATMFAEDPDPNVANIINGMLNAAPAVAHIDTLIEQNNAYDLSISRTVAETVDELSRLRLEGKSIEHYFLQPSLPGVQQRLSKTGEDLLRIFDKFKRSGKKITDFLVGYCDVVKKLGSPMQPTFEEVVIPTRAEIMQAVIERMLGNEQPDLFSGEAGSRISFKENDGLGGQSRQAVEQSAKTKPIAIKEAKVETLHSRRGAISYKDIKRETKRPLKSKDFKREKIDNIYSQSFKRWFGDWQKEPKNASKITNEDGTPKIVYHGTGSVFTTFDITKGRANMDIQGSFFSPWALDAKGYGENVRAFYLNIKNPAPENIAYKALNRFKGQNNAGIKARKYLESLGYDGVNNSDEEYVAFYPEQIKSATDNIGTYDPKNPDTRFSTMGEPISSTNQKTTKWLIDRLKKSGLEVITNQKEFTNNISGRPDRGNQYIKPDGTVYGYVRGGKIYLNPDAFTADTVVHEYTHLWGDAIRSEYPKVWQNIVNLMKGTPIWDEVKKSRSRIDINDDNNIADEVLATYSGRQGAERVNELSLTLGSRIIDRIRNAITRFWQQVREFFGFDKYKTAEEVANAALSDLLSGYRPTSDEKKTRFSVKDIQKLTYKFGDMDISMKTFTDVFQSAIKAKDRTIEDAERIANDYINSAKENAPALFPKVTGETLKYEQYLMMPDGTTYDPNKAEHADASDITRQIYFAKENGSLPQLLSREAEEINKKREADLTQLIRYFQDNTDYAAVEKAIIIQLASKYGIGIRRKGDQVGVDLITISNSNRVEVPVVDGVMASYVVSALREGMSSRKALQKAALESVKSAAGKRGVPANYTGWKSFKKSYKDEDAIALNNAVKGCSGGWCTGGAVSTARSHLSGGDFHVWFNRGEPAIAIRTNNGQLAEPPRGSLDGQKMTEEEEIVAERFLRGNNGVTGGEKYLADRDDIQKFKSGKMTLKDAFFLPRERRVDNGEFGDNLRAWPKPMEKEVERLLDDPERLSKGYYFAGEERDNASEVIYFANTSDDTYLIDSGDLPKLEQIAGHTEIFGSAHFPNLKTIAGNTFIYANVNAPNLASIDGNASIRKDAQVPNLVSIGGDAYIQMGCQAPKLETVSGGATIYENAQVPNLVSIGKEAYIAKDVQVPSLKTVGWGVTISAGVEVPNLVSIGKDAYIREGVQVPKLKTIGAYADIRKDVQVPSLETIGGDASIYMGVKVPKLKTIVGGVSIYAGTKVPNLVSIGKDAYIAKGGQVPKLETIGGEANISADAKVPNLKSVGKDAYIRVGVQVPKLKTIGGLAHISEGAQVPNLVSIGREAKISTGVHLPKLETIGDYAEIEEGVQLPELKTIGRYALISEGVQVPNLVSIKGRAEILKGVQAPNLETIGGKADIHEGVQVPKLETIGGEATIRLGAQVPNLETIGGKAYIHRSVKASNLVSIGGSAHIAEGVQVPKLKTIGGTASIHEGVEVPNLETVGEGAIINDGTKVPKLKTIGGAGTIRGGAQVPKLETIGGEAIIRAGAQAPSLVSIGGDAYIYKDAYLPNLETIGGEAHIAPGAQVPNLKSVGGKPFNREQPLYSAEYLVAKYAAKGIKQAKKVIQRGLEIMSQGVRDLAGWAKQMLREFGQNIKDYVRGLYKDLATAFKERGLHSRRGAISYKDIRRETKRLLKSKDFKWEKIDKDTYLLQFTSPVDGEKSTVAKLARNKTGKGSHRWIWVGSKYVFLDANIAKATVKSKVFEKMKRLKVERDKVEKVAKMVEKKEREEIEKAKAYMAEGDNRSAEVKLPKTYKDRIKHLVNRAEEVLFDIWAPVRRLQEEAKNKIGEIPDSLNLYRKLELVSGKIEEHVKSAKKKYLEDVKDILIKNGIEVKKFNRFLYVSHAEERNEAINKLEGSPFKRLGRPGSGISTEQARKELEEFEALPNYAAYKEAAEITYKLNNFLLDEQVRLGLLTQEQRDHYRKYKKYTPLKSPPDQGLILDRRALGRRSQASEQLAFIEQSIYAVYNRGFKKDISSTAIKLFKAFPNKALYERVKPRKVQYINKKGKVTVRQEMEKFFGRPEMLWAKDPATGDYVVYKIKDKSLREALVNNFKEDTIETNFFRFFKKVNNWLAATATAWNPEFIYTNLIRDVQQGAAGVGVMLPEGSTVKFLSNLKRARQAIADDKAGNNTEDAVLLKEYKLAGGKTGYSEFSRLEERASNLEKEVSQAIKGGKLHSVKQSLKKALDFISEWNDAIETRTRFAGYLTAKEAGFSTQKAAAFAKNMTVNFNKKGSWAPILNSLYLFSSANLGGNLVTAKVLAKASKTKKGKAMIAGAVTLGFVSEIINSLIAGDDDEDGVNYYDKVADYIKDSNFVFMIPGGKGKYVAIPMPYGLNVLPSIGRNMAASMFGQQTAKDGAANIIGNLLDAFNPLGGDRRSLPYHVVPTAARPFVDVATNTTWTGRKIRPEQEVFGSDVARAELYYADNSKVIVEISKFLNEISGGDRYKSGFLDFLTPGEIEHLLAQSTGGVGKTITRAADLVTKSEKELTLNTLPIMRRFINSSNDYQSYEAFRTNAEMIKDFERAKREKDVEWLKDKRWLVPATEKFKRIQKITTQVNKSKLSELQKRERILNEMKGFNKYFDKLKSKVLSRY